MALQLPQFDNWTERFTNPEKFTARVNAVNATSTDPSTQFRNQQQAVTSPVVQRMQQQLQPQYGSVVQQVQQPKFVQPTGQDQNNGNIWSTIGSFLGADSFKRTGEGIAEVINEWNGNAQKERDANEQRQQQDIALIKHYGDLIRNGDEGQKIRARAALKSLIETSSQQDKDWQARQQEIAERTDPVKGAGAIVDLGLTYGTLGVGAGATKAAAATGKILTKQAAKEAAIGSALGFGSGVAGAYEQNGAAANNDPNTFIQGLIGAAVGGGIPIVGKAIGKGMKYVIDKDGNTVPVPQADIPKQLNHYTTAEAKKSINKGGFEIRKTKSVQGDGIYFLNKDDPSMVMADVVNEAKIRGRLAPDTRIMDLSSPDYKGPSPTSGNKLRKYAERNGFDGATDGSQTVIYNADKVLNGRPKITVKAVVNEVKEAPKPKVAIKGKVNETTPAIESELTKPSARLKKGSRGEISSKLDSVDENDVFGNRNIIKRVKNELGKHFVDDDNQMLNLLGRIEKETGRTGLKDQYYYDTGRIRVANAIADHRITNSDSIHKLFGGLKDYTKVGRKLRQLAGQDGKSELDRFDEYASARAELQNYKGKKTSKSREELAGIVVNGHEEFGDRFKAMNDFYKDQSRYLYENGIISKKKMESYQKNPDYIRIQRDVDDLVNRGTMTGKSKSQSFASTTTKQRRKGSEREVLSPTKTLLERAQQMELEVQRNRAANHTIDTLSEYGLARRVANADGKNTVARFKGGKKEFWEVPGDVKKEMENLNPYTMGPVMHIISAPNRLLRAGATGLNVPFAAANYMRDQAGSFIQSKNVMYTHNPVTIIKSLGSAARDIGDGSNDPLWKKFEEFTGNSTVYDELRNQKATVQTLRELRQGSKGKALNRVISPVRSLEDLIGVTEKATRFQNFKGAYQEALKSGLTEREALQQATLAARKNTTDFNRAGDWGRVLNGFIPYFNASIQGTRTMARSFKERPVATSIKTLGTMAIPGVAATLWNYADPKRAEAYNSINDFEKKDNWIIVGPDARQRSDGTWEGVYKIPKPPGYRDLTDPVRDVTEMFAKGENHVDVGNMLQDVLGAMSGPIQTGSGDQVIGSLIPQQAKPFAQAYFNKNFYTGKDVVPDYMLDATDDKSKQAYKSTSGTARMLAKQFGVSPITVEQFIRDSGASVGQYALNAVDTAANKAGLIPDEQIGGKSALDDVVSRFGEARGDLLERNKTDGQKYFEAREKATEGLSKQEKEAYNTLHPSKKNFLGDVTYDADSIYNAAARLDTYNRFPAVFEADKKLDAIQRAKGEAGNPMFDLSREQLKKVLEKDNLPPGAKDPELSNLYKQDWYVDYQNKRTEYYDSVNKKLEAQGKSLGNQENPYPTTPANVQADMNYYNSLPKGTGARSAWIKANPDSWNAMQNQYAAVDDWQNKQRAKRGLDATEGSQGQANGYSTSSSSSSGGSSYSRRSSGGSSSKSSGINEYGYLVKRGGATINLKAPAAKSTAAKAKVAKATVSKPKVSLKKTRI